MVSGPGEGLEVRIYDTGKETKLLDTYENPALKATSARGIWMLRSAMDRGAEAMIVSGAGAHAFTFAKGKLKIYLGAGLSVAEAISSFMNGKLSELTAPTHEHGHHDHNEH
ncbi:MAG: NifB/NifX family molybdenum-iron cluster-binding protein [Thermoplasmataceae archaeon]